MKPAGQFEYAWITSSPAQLLLNKMKKLLIVIAVALTTSCISTPVNEQPVPFATLARGNYCAVTKPQDHIIQSQAELQKFWKKLDLVEQKMPPIDFNAQTVLAIFMGEQTSGGYAIRIDRIVRTPKSIIVMVRKILPAKDEQVSMALSQPYILVSIPHTDLPIKFEYKTD